MKLVLLVTILAACTALPADESSVDQTERSSRIAYSPDASPLGRDMVAWSQDWWRWIYAQPADTNPIFDLTGTDCAVGQRGDAFFLASVVDPGGASTVERHCTIPAHEPILISPSGSLNDFPCPDPSFQPAPGQTLYDFLRDGIRPIVDSVDDLDVTLDGRALADPFAYRFTSRHVFHIDGDPSLTPVLDGCITGHPQPAVSDGYFTMLKGLDRGTHTLEIHAHDTKGTDVTIVWTLEAVHGHR